ncbi:MAG: hypothetical protein IID42_12890 [Planctomycetes bacterium]|nr:hypothetical protein [Planctomycetota bacterium]
MANQERLDGDFAMGAKPVVGFFIRFMVLFVVLTAPWPGLPKVYAPIYRAVGNVLFVRFGSGGAVRLQSSGWQDSAYDTNFVLTNRNNGAEYVFRGTSLKGYQPTAFLFCLILATPIPWSRRWRGLLWGLAIVSVYAALRAALFLFFAFSEGNHLVQDMSESGSLALFTLGPFGRSVLEYLYWVFVESFAGWLFVPLPIWALVCFWQSDRWTKSKAARPPQDEAAKT